MDGVSLESKTAMSEELTLDIRLKVTDLLDELAQH